MRALIQRVSAAAVRVDKRVVGEIQSGLVLLLGIGQTDTETEAAWLRRKLLALRIFTDEAGKMNLALPEIQGSLLVVSQFTLWADTRRGNRPSYSDAAPPVVAEPLYTRFVADLDLDMAALGLPPVKTGIFGAHMELSLVNDGPVTIWLDSANK